MNINVSNELVGSLATIYSLAFAPPESDHALANTLSSMLPPSPMLKQPLIGSPMHSKHGSLSSSPMIRGSLASSPAGSLGSSLDNMQSDHFNLRKEIAIKDSGEVYQTGYHLYWIANYTGETIEYYVEEGKYAEWNTAKASVEHTIEHGQKIPLRLSRSLFKVCVL